MKRFALCLLLCLGLISCKNTNEKENPPANPSIQKKIANANGLQKFQDIKKLEFTFNVKVNDTLRASRSWTWKPQTHEITLSEEGNSQSYKKDGYLTDDEKKIDQKFINDSYWLLFPFQMVWSDAKISDKGKATAPISKKEMDKLTVAYSDSGGGYTPGDTYEVFYDENFMIREWIYKPANGKSQMATTWEDYEDFDGLKIAKDHKSADGSFELFFSGIDVE